MNKLSAFDEILNYNKCAEHDYYYILGCDETSSEEQITSEYKSRVLSCHPDKHPNDPTAHKKFSALSQAKEVLLNPEKRKEYDQWRHSNIAISFETWKSLPQVKTSMHWGYHKDQASVSYPEMPEPQPTLVPISQPTKSQSLINTEEKLKFQLREQPVDSSRNGWDRQDPSPLLEKFRSYQI
ncbi:dnaJ homolog subfamily C member 12-like [Physella acuta]|uniref:dnaJ homolog subfamily C member 12-like n=1 Tax=Physella acuta TaxID=109671 RepID=UPI0027DB5B07|nr:dnaJ homolog subfamily C member 12-like [Physella acuta]